MGSWGDRERRPRMGWQKNRIIARLMPMETTIERRDSGNEVELLVSGWLDAESGEQLERAVEEELRRGRHTIRLDLSAVSFLSSAGIRLLFNTYRAAKAVGGQCLVGAASEQVTRVLQVTKLDSFLLDSRQVVAESAATLANAAGAESEAVAADICDGRIVLVGLEPPGRGHLQATLIGSTDATLLGSIPVASVRQFSRHSFGLGIGALAKDAVLAAHAGEMLAACGAVFYRPPQPLAAIDYLIGADGLVPEIQMAAGLAWEGLPRGRAGFEPASDESSVRFSELAGQLLERSQSETIAIVLIGEVSGLVGVELIRPLAEASSIECPRAGIPAVAARWLSFSREPVHARRTALVVGVVTSGEPQDHQLHSGHQLHSFVRPLGEGDLFGHAHAAIFPFRPLKRGTVDLLAMVDALASSEPLAVMHLLDDPQPMLGSGQSEFVRGCCWFAPLSIGTGVQP